MKTKKDKIKELLNRLNTLEGKEVLPSEMDSLTESLIKEEVSKVEKQVRENPNIKTLQKFGNELEKFKKDFDLKPIIENIKELQNEIEENQNSLVADFKDELQSKIDEVRKTIPKIPEPEIFDDSNLIRDIKILRQEFLAKQDFDAQPLEKEIKNLQSELKDLFNKIKDTSKSDKQKKDIEDKIEKVRQEFLQKLSTINFGRGGSMNRQIRVEGTDVLTRYTDINFYGTTSSVLAANNDTHKRVDIGIQGGGGGTVGPGTINEIAYFDTANTVASLAIATYPSLTELSYVKGVTSAIQTQINAINAYGWFIS